MHAGMHVRGVHGISSVSKETSSPSLQEYCTKTLDYDVRCMIYVEEDREMHFAEFDGSITTISIESGIVTKRLPRKCECIWGLAAVRDELWAACSDGDIIAYHRSSGKVLAKWQGHLGGTFCVASVGDKVISGGADWVVRVWSNYGEQSKCFFGHTNAVRCLLVVDLTVWSGADDRSIRVWPLFSSSNDCIQELQGHTDSVLCMCKCDTVSPQTVWTSGADQTIRVWDTSYRCSHKLKSHKGWVTGLVVAGRTVWSSSADKTIVIWDLPGLRVKRTLRDHSTYLRGITLANYQIVSYAADRSVRFWHCTELYQGMILKIQKEVNGLMDQLTEKNRKEGELKSTLVNCYSTIETLERDSDTRRQITKERDDLKYTVNDLTNKITRLEKENQANYTLATQTQTWTASQEKMMNANFKLLQDMLDSDSSLDYCTQSTLAIKRIDLDVSAEKVKLLQATQKLEEIYAKQTAQTMNHAILEAAWASRIRELEYLVEGEKEKVGDAVRKREEAILDREKIMQEAMGKVMSSVPKEDTSLASKLQEADVRAAEAQLTIDSLTRRVNEMQEENKALNEKLIAGEQNIKTLRRRSKREKENYNDYLKHLTELQDELAIAKSTAEAATAAATAAASHAASNTTNNKPRSDIPESEKVNELENSLALARQEKSDLTEKIREYARRALDLEQQLSRSQEDNTDYNRRCRELEMQLGRLERSMSRDDFSTHSGLSSIAEEGSSTQDMMKLIEEVETLNAEKRVQKQEMEEALRSKAELAKTVESLKQESILIVKTQHKPQSAIQALIDKTHRLEAQLAQALKDNASLQKYQKEVQKQAELKQMIEGMISKVLDMETQLVLVTKERDELNEELYQFKSAGLADREDKQKLYAMQLVLNQTRAQNNVLDNELKGTREKLRKEEEEASKTRVSCEHLTLRVAGLEELLKKMGSVPPERSVIHSFY